MKKTRGYIVSWITKDNTLQKGIVYHCEQSAAFIMIKSVYIHLVNDDLTPTKDPENGKNVVTLKKAELLTTLGFVD